MDGEIVKVVPRRTDRVAFTGGAGLVGRLIS